MTKILVCGGRDYDDWRKVFDVLSQLHDEAPITQITHGGASGADSLAAEWAYNRYIPCRSVPAQWSVYGPKAGPIRNQQMVDAKPDLVVAFPGGKGTRDCVKRARAAGLRVIEVQPCQSDGTDREPTP